MHRGRRACSICFSVPGLPHSMFLFHFHPYPSNFIISLTVTDVCVRSMLSIYQWMDGWADSASWLLWVEWQWRQMSNYLCSRIWASGYMPRSGIAGSYGSSISGYLRYCHTDVLSGRTSLHSHQQRERLPLPPYPCQHLSSFDFSMIVILTGVKWNLKAVLICIFLVAKDVEHF